MMPLPTGWPPVEMADQALNEVVGRVEIVEIWKLARILALI
jgi:hypothetical protein